MPTLKLPNYDRKLSVSSLLTQNTEDRSHIMPASAMRMQCSGCAGCSLAVVLGWCPPTDWQGWCGQLGQVSGTANTSAFCVA